MNKFLIFIFILFCLSYAGEGGKKDWRSIQNSDTLEVLLNDQNAGMLYSTLSVKDSAIEVINRFEIGTSMHERRVYSFDGKLIYAEQEMNSPSGKNYWKLSMKTDKWVLTVNAGGVEQNKNVLSVHESIDALFQIYKGIRNSSIKIGNSWTDTAFELTSGEYVITRTICKEIPSGKNGFLWVFVCSNNITGKDEIWKLDKKGKTLYREVYPFIARSSNHSQKRSSVEQADLLEAFKIPVSALSTPSQRIFISFDSTNHLDSTVLSYYQKSGNGYFLKDLNQKCVNRPVNEVLTDSLLMYTIATPTMQTNHPEIIGLTKRLQKGTGSICDLVKTYNDSVYRMIRKKNTATFSSAVETLKSGFGDCGEHAVLLAALLRAAGIPARVVMGLVYMEYGKGYYYHAWVSVYAGEWIFADPSHGVFPANYDRIPLMIDDSGQRLLQLSKLIGRIRIEHKNR